MIERQLKEIVSELLTRPGHEKVRANLLRLELVGFVWTGFRA